MIFQEFLLFCLFDGKTSATDFTDENKNSNLMAILKS